MSLLEKAKEPCVRLIPGETVPDGHGGYTTSWTEGGKFDAIFDFQTSIEAKVAEAQGVTGLWNILVPKSLVFEFHNVFKRLSDGQVFRITSKDDKKTPEGASFDLKLVSAEEWELI